MTKSTRKSRRRRPRCRRMTTAAADPDDPDTTRPIPNKVEEARTIFPSYSNDAILAALLILLIKDMESIQEVNDAIGAYEEEHHGEKIQKLALTSPKLREMLVDLNTEEEQNNIKKNELKMRDRILSLTNNNPESHSVTKADTNDGKPFFFL